MMFSLFDKMVIVSYVRSLLEKVDINLCKIFSCVSKTTHHLDLYGELGRYLLYRYSLQYGQLLTQIA